MPDRGRPIGYIMTTYYCMGCAPEGLRDFYPPTEFENDKVYGSPYHCDICMKEFKPEND